MANGVYSREIQLRHGDRFLRAAGGNHAPPRVTDDGVAPCVVGRALVARGRGADGKTWLSTARWRNSSSQCAGPVVMLKAAGTNSTFAPRSVMSRASSSNRKSKQMQSPIVPQGVSNVVMSLPGVSVSDSMKRCPPATSISKRCVLRWRAAQEPSGA